MRGKKIPYIEKREIDPQKRASALEPQGIPDFFFLSDFSNTIVGIRQEYCRIPTRCDIIGPGVM